MKTNNICGSRLYPFCSQIAPDVVSTNKPKKKKKKKILGLCLALTPDAIVFKPHSLCSWMPTLPVAKSPRSSHMSTRDPLHFALWIRSRWLIPLCNKFTFFYCFFVATHPSIITLNHLLVGNYAPWHVDMQLCFKRPRVPSFVLIRNVK